jgi:hypothetical protein
MADDRGGVSVVEATETWVTTDAVVVRRGPGKTFARVANLPRGSTVRQVAETKDVDRSDGYVAPWREVTLPGSTKPGKTGWVYGGYLQLAPHEYSNEGVPIPDSVADAPFPGLIRAWIHDYDFRDYRVVYPEQAVTDEERTVFLPHAGYGKDSWLESELPGDAPVTSETVYRDFSRLVTIPEVWGTGYLIEGHPFYRLFRTPEGRWIDGSWDDATVDVVKGWPPEPPGTFYSGPGVSPQPFLDAIDRKQSEAQEFAKVFPSSPSDDRALESALTKVLRAAYHFDLPRLADAVSSRYGLPLPGDQADLTVSADQLRHFTTLSGEVKHDNARVRLDWYTWQLNAYLPQSEDHPLDAYVDAFLTADPHPLADAFENAVFVELKWPITHDRFNSWGSMAFVFVREAGDLALAWWDCYLGSGE